MRYAKLVLLAAACAASAADTGDDDASQSWYSASVPQATADKLGAKCLGGGPPAYNFRLNPNSDKWILFLEGGGWCYGPDFNSTVASCRGRASTAFTTSAPAADGYGGVLSSNPAINPDFHTWNAVFIRYCDGASFGGARTDPVPGDASHPGEIWLRGKNVFTAVIADLIASRGMDAATEVILSGGSAGGLAVFYNLDHLATLLPPTTRLTGFPDAGFFLDGEDMRSGARGYRELFRSADAVWNVTGGGGTNAACLASYRASGEQWRCLMAPYLAPFVATPMFVMNSAYDAWQLTNILGAECVAEQSCDAAANASVQAYRDQFVAAVANVTAGKPGNGVYVDSCYVHEQNLNYCSGQSMPNCVGWSPLESGSQKWGYRTSVSGADGAQLTPQQAFSRWYFGKGDTVTVDALRFPANPSCTYHAPPSSSAANL